MSINNYIIFGLIAVAIFTVYMAIVNAARRDRTKAIVKQISVGMAHNSDEDYYNLTPLASGLKQALAAIGIDINQQRETIIQLGKAGYSSQNSLIYFLAFKRFVQPILLVIGVIIIAKLVIYDLPRISKHLELLISGFLFIVAGSYGAALFLKNTADKRSKQLLRSFPDALDLILICVESGLGIDAAFARTCKEMKASHPVVASEFDRTRFEMTMMNDRIQALQNFSDRTGLAPVRSLVSSLIQAEKFGTSLIDTMRMISEEQRTDRMMNAEARAARLPALITVPLIFFILPGLFMIILAPAMIKLSAQGGLFGGN